MIDDAVLLARVQFAFTMAFHIIFPSFTIGLVAWIATLEAMWLSTGRERYYLLARFWTKIFAISFAMGVVSGLVMSYQLGTNWSRYSRIIVFGAGILYIRRLIKKGPEAKPAGESEIMANRPISAALEEGRSAGNVAIVLQRAE